MANQKFTSQNAIDERAAIAYFEAYSAALAAGKTTAEAMQAAEAARRAVNSATQTTNKSLVLMPSINAAHC